MSIQKLKVGRFPSMIISFIVIMNYSLDINSKDIGIYTKEDWSMSSSAGEMDAVIPAFAGLLAMVFSRICE